jgi:hypothetical protein
MRRTSFTSSRNAYIFRLGGFATHGYLSDLVVIEEIPFGKK